MVAFLKAVNLILSFLSVTRALSHSLKTTMNHDAHAFNEYASAAVDLLNAHVDHTGLLTSMYSFFIRILAVYRIDVDQCCNMRFLSFSQCTQ